MEIDIPDLDDVVFDFTCSRCYGSGITRHYVGQIQVPILGPPSRCDRCDGKGKIISAVGHKLITFLKERGVELKEKE